MDARIAKLKILIGDEDAATKLVAGGFDTPRKIKKTTKTELRRVLSRAKVNAIKARFGG